jgi:DNA-3-methyladenine glycosylase
MSRLLNDFFIRDVLEVAPLLLGKFIVLSHHDTISEYMITETEAYRGMEDLACHASKGRTKRTEIMYSSGGKIYVYLIYGMYWMLNFVTGDENNPQAVLIRGIQGKNGPGRIARELNIDKSFYGIDLCISERIWVVDKMVKVNYSTTPRIGVDYSGEIWKNKLWRFVLDSIQP